MNFSKLGRVDKIQAKENEMKQVIAGEMETWIHWCKSSSNSLSVSYLMSPFKHRKKCVVFCRKKNIYIEDG